MRIGILGYVGPQRTGIGRYVDEVVSRWAARCRGEGHTVQIYLNRDSPLQIASESWIRREYIPAPADSALRNLLWVVKSPGVYEAAQLDVIWLPNVTWAPRVRTPIVSTIHDILEFRVPKKLDRLRILYRRRATPRLARRSRHILSVSETSKQDIIKQFRVSADKVTVVPNGVSAQFRPDRCKEFQGLATRWNLRRPYVLYVGTLDHPGKNAATLLRAFAAAREDLPTDTQLVLAGKPGKGFAKLQAIAEALNLGPTASDARWLGFVPEEALPALYASASMLVFPSLYEGFGLPVLEAMASGVPTVTSDIGALREVSGGATVLVPPLDTQAVADAIVTLFRDPDLARECRRRGLERARAFSWDRAAHTILDVLLACAHGAEPHPLIPSPRYEERGRASELHSPPSR